jgi:GDP-L-fucose synthase
MKKNLLVTGGSGFIGTNLLKALTKLNRYKITATYFSSKNFYKVKNVKYIKTNLENPKSCLKIAKNIDIIVMCAANSSGAAVMEKSPLVHLTPNIRMNLNMLEAGHFYSVSKFIFISSNTVYPVSDLAMKESDAQFNFFEKYHIVGWMKRFSEIVCEIYSKKIKNKMKTIIIRPGNLYGPHDKFDPKKSKVIPSLISRISARQDPINVWGDGKDLKDFLYIDDFCNILVKIINRVNSFEIYNVASGKSVTIQKILKILIKIENLNNNKIYYDVSKPTMIPKRLISIMKIKKQFKFKPSISLHEGLARTVKWYKKKRIYDNHKNTV